MSIRIDNPSTGGGNTPSNLFHPETIVVPEGTGESWYWPKGSNERTGNYWSIYSVGLIPIRFSKGMVITQWGMFLNNNVSAADLAACADADHTGGYLFNRAFVYEADEHNRPHTLVADLGINYIAGYDADGPSQNAVTTMVTNPPAPVYLQPNKLYYIGTKNVVASTDGNEIQGDFYLSEYSLYNNGGTSPLANMPLDANSEYLPYNQLGFNGFFSQSIADTKPDTALPETLGEYGTDIFSSSFPMSIFVKAVID